MWAEEPDCLGSRPVPLITISVALGKFLNLMLYFFYNGDDADNVISPKGHCEDQINECLLI